jgi:hypothetical protein
MQLEAAVSARELDRHVSVGDTAAIAYGASQAEMAVADEADEGGAAGRARHGGRLAGLGAGVTVTWVAANASGPLTASAAAVSPGSLIGRRTGQAARSVLESDRGSGFRRARESVPFPLVIARSLPLEPVADGAAVGQAANHLWLAAHHCAATASEVPSSRVVIRASGIPSASSMYHKPSATFRNMKVTIASDDQYAPVH